MTFRMGSGVFTPMPQARIMPSSRIFESAGKAPLRDDFVLLLPAVRKKGEIRRDVVDEGDIEAVDAEALQAVLDRAAHAVGRVVVDDVVRRIGQRVDLRMAIVLRCLEELPDLRGQQVFAPLLSVQKSAETPLGQTEPIPWRDVEVADADFPGRLERARRLPCRYVC